MTKRKDLIVSLVGTFLFHLIIILLLLFAYIKPNLNTRFAEELEGVPVMFGNVPDAFGDDEPFGRGDGTPIINETLSPNVAESASANVAEDVTASDLKNNETVKTIPSKERAVTTQDFEETIAVKSKAEKKAETEKKKQEAELTERRKKEAEIERKAKAEAEQKNKINNQMAGLFGNGSGEGSRGNTAGKGTQGVPTGNASFGKTSGIGGWGSYDLGGRSLGKGGLAQPSYSVDDYGTVVIDIVVNPRGDVVEATIGRGTNTPSTILKNESLKAARKTKFNAVNTAGNQKGTITYKFNLN